MSDLHCDKFALNAPAFELIFSKIKYKAASLSKAKFTKRKSAKDGEQVKKSHLLNKQKSKPIKGLPFVFACGYKPIYAAIYALLLIC